MIGPKGLENEEISGARIEFADFISYLKIPKDSENISCKSGQRNASADATIAMDAMAGAAEVAAEVAGVAEVVACKATPCSLAKPRTMLRTSEAVNWYRLQH